MLPREEYLFINTDLTLYIEREPVELVPLVVFGGCTVLMLVTALLLG